MGARKATGRQLAPVAEGEEVDEAYWANANARQSSDDDAVQGDYDANFFQDDNLPLPGGIDPDDDDVLEFADAREHLSPGIADEVDAAGGPEGPGIDGVVAGEANGGDFGANLVAQSRRLRPEYVQYARVAK
jgi:condensin complex subunit 2